MAGYFTEHPEAHRRMLEVHVVVPLRLIAAVAPGMKERRNGLIVNVSSVAAFFPMPEGSTYAATKRYLNTFSESLYLELRPYGIKVQSLCPGMTRTDFHSRNDKGRQIANRNILGWMSPETVVRKALRHAAGPKVVYIPGLKNKILVGVVSRLPRRLYYRIASQI
jgi:short-subunit dehydrogenase